MSLIARTKIKEDTPPGETTLREVTITRPVSAKTVQISSDLLYPLGLLSPLHTARGAQECHVNVCVSRGREGGRGGKHTVRAAGQVSLKNRVAIPVSTWRKMKRAFHAPSLFSRFLVMNSSASHYGEFPRERTQHKLRVPTVGFRHDRLKTAPVPEKKFPFRQISRFPSTCPSTICRV